MACSGFRCIVAVDRDARRPSLGRRFGARGERIVIVIGRPDYYPRLGFSRGRPACSKARSRVTLSGPWNLAPAPSMQPHLVSERKAPCSRPPALTWSVHPDMRRCGTASHQACPASSRQGRVVLCIAKSPFGHRSIRLLDTCPNPLRRKPGGPTSREVGPSISSA